MSFKVLFRAADLRPLKDKLIDHLPDVVHGHRCEVLAASVGFGTMSALQASLAKGPVLASVDPVGFSERLSSLGYDVPSVVAGTVSKRLPDFPKGHALEAFLGFLWGSLSTPFKSVPTPAVERLHKMHQEACMTDPSEKAYFAGLDRLLEALDGGEPDGTPRVAVNGHVQLAHSRRGEVYMRIIASRSVGAVKCLVFEASVDSGHAEDADRIWPFFDYLEEKAAERSGVVAVYGGGLGLLEPHFAKRGYVVSPYSKEPEMIRPFGPRFDEVAEVPGPRADVAA